MNTGIYLITCAENGRRYVGSAVNISKRWRDHKRQLRSGTHHSRFMQRSWVKYGEQAFEFSTVVVCSKENLIEYEQRFIDGLRPEFNSAPNAGSQLGYRHTNETRTKMSASRAKDFSPFTGRYHTEESRLKISENRAGKGGGPMSAERRAKIGAAHKGRVISEEHRAKIAAKLMGHKQSAEQIEKRMQKIRGRKMPDGFAEAQSARRMGMKFSSDHCMNMARSRAKLSEDQVREIRRRVALGEKQRQIGELMGVSRATIADISSCRKYKWVSE